MGGLGDVFCSGVHQTVGNGPGSRTMGISQYLIMKREQQLSTEFQVLDIVFGNLFEICLRVYSRAMRERVQKIA